MDFPDAPPTPARGSMKIGQSVASGGTLGEVSSPLQIATLQAELKASKGEAERLKAELEKLKADLQAKPSVAAPAPAPPTQPLRKGSAEVMADVAKEKEEEESLNLMERVSSFFGGGGRKKSVSKAAAPAAAAAAAPELSAPAVAKLDKIATELGLRWLLPEDADAAAAVAAAKEELGIEASGTLEQQVQVLWETLQVDIGSVRASIAADAAPADEPVGTFTVSINPPADGKATISIIPGNAATPPAPLPPPTAAPLPPPAAAPLPPPAAAPTNPATQALIDGAVERARAAAAAAAPPPKKAAAEKQPPKAIICGAPASGKGTQCELLKERYGVVHLSTGDMLRAAVAEGTPVGLKAKGYMDRGELVPDGVIIGVVKDRLAQKDCQQDGWLLDGFPRTEAQAVALKEAGVEPDTVLFLRVPDAMLVERVVGRRLDPTTGKIYHLALSPPESAEVAARLTHRADDTEEKVKVRLGAFHQNMASVEKCYAGKIAYTDGTQTKDAVFAELIKSLPKPKPKEEEAGAEAPAEEWTIGGWLDSLDLSKPVAAALLAPLVAARGRGGGTGGNGEELSLVKTLGMLDEAEGHAAVAALLAAGAFPTGPGVDVNFGADVGAFERAVAAELYRGMRQLSTQKAASGLELNQKFMQDGGAFTMSYGGLDTFFGGLESLIGAPNPSITEAMRREHCDSADSHEGFTTSNYRLSSSSEIEWFFVVEPTAEQRKRLGLGDEWPAEESLRDQKRMHLAREPRPPSAFAAPMGDVNGKLGALGEPGMIIEELWGARLYTGPLFVKYNGVLRGVSSSVPFLIANYERLCKGNQYTTTLHVINSAIVKLGKLMTAEKVYRGISGATLPDNFWQPNEFKVRGGVEFGFMSTTLNGEVAMDYAAGGGAGVIFEIQQGMVDRGADLSWLSQVVVPLPRPPPSPRMMHRPHAPLHPTTQRPPLPSHPIPSHSPTSAILAVPAREGDPLRAADGHRGAGDARRQQRPRRQRAAQRQPERADHRAGRQQAAQDGDGHVPQRLGRGARRDQRRPRRVAAGRGALRAGRRQGRQGRHGRHGRHGRQARQARGGRHRRRQGVPGAGAREAAGAARVAPGALVQR